jgi:hypothetical protein
MSSRELSAFSVKLIRYTPLFIGLQLAPLSQFILVEQYIIVLLLNAMLLIMAQEL